jgi:hypothetical protein
MRPQVLKALMNQRRGTPVRAFLSPANAKKLARIKQGANRPYRAIMLFAAKIYTVYPERFPPMPAVKKYACINFRLMDAVVSVFNDEAWRRHESLGALFNDLVEALDEVKMIEALRQQKDRIADIMEESA